MYNGVLQNREKPITIKAACTKNDGGKKDKKISKDATKQGWGRKIYMFGVTTNYTPALSGYGHKTHNCKFYAMVQKINAP
jgi:hypothetical protein